MRIPGTLHDAATEPAAEGALHCIACGHEHAGGRPILRADAERRPFDLARCPSCGLVQQHPRWSEDRLSALYDDDYYVFRESDEHRWARAVQQYVVHLARFEGAGLRMLDVGCALGHLSAIARARGWRVTALDLSAHAASESAVRFGLEVRAGTLSRHRSTLWPFDVVMLGDVIEHVFDPRTLLDEVSDVLSAGGLVCIDTPNWGSRWRRWGRSTWLGLNRYHVNLFDAEALASLLSACGFRDVSIGSYTHYRYESWASRPEIRSWVDSLPGVFSSPLSRVLCSRRPATPWAVLRESPPRNLDEAVSLVAAWRHTDAASLSGRSNADNLAATARRAG